MMAPISCIAIVATSSMPSQEQLDEILKYFPAAYPRIMIKNYVVIAPLTEAQRFDLLWQALLDPQVDLVWAVRGGAGCAELIPYLHERRAQLSQLKPKLLLGFSDVTALLYYWEQTLKWPAIHGPGVGHFALKTVDEISCETIHQLLEGNLQKISLVCQPLNQAAKKMNTKSFPCFAGNLTLFGLSGRELWEPAANQLKESVLIIEDVNEPAYKVERAFRHLQRINFLQGRVLVLGDFFCNPLHSDPERAKKETVWLRAFFEKFAQELSMPVYQTHQVGHGRANHLVPFGWNAHFEAQQLIIEAPQ